MFLLYNSRAGFLLTSLIIVVLWCVSVKYTVRANARKEGNVLFNDALKTFYGYMASDIWLRTTQIVREETCCRYIDYSFRLAARVLLYAPFHRHGALAGMTGITKAVACVILSVIHIKEPLLLIGKSSPCGGRGFPLSLSEWSFTICLMPYNRK